MQRLVADSAERAEFIEPCIASSFIAESITRCQCDKFDSLVILVNIK